MILFTLWELTHQVYHFHQNSLTFPSDGYSSLQKKSSMRVVGWGNLVYFRSKNIKTCAQRRGQWLINKTLFSWICNIGTKLKFCDSNLLPCRAAANSNMELQPVFVLDIFWEISFVLFQCCKEKWNFEVAKTEIRICYPNNFC